jgi:hypothetical protein
MPVTGFGIMNVNRQGRIWCFANRLGHDNGYSLGRNRSQLGFHAGFALIGTCLLNPDWWCRIQYHLLRSKIFRSSVRLSARNAVSKGWRRVDKRFVGMRLRSQETVMDCPIVIETVVKFRTQMDFGNMVYWIVRVAKRVTDGNRRGAFAYRRNTEIGLEFLFDCFQI